MAKYILVLKSTAARDSVRVVLPISTSTETLTDARRALRWQKSIGNTAACVIAKPTHQLGVLEELEKPGIPLLLERGCITEEAFERLTLDLWGDMIDSRNSHGAK